MYFFFKKLEIYVELKSQDTQKHTNIIHALHTNIYLLDVDWLGILESRIFNWETGFYQIIKGLLKSLQEFDCGSATV